MDCQWSKGLTCGEATMTSLTNTELLTVEEFAKRLRVGRSTVFDWIAKKKMVQGVHYFRINKTIRIPWTLELLASLSTETDEPEKDRTYKSKQIINLDY